MSGVIFKTFFEIQFVLQKLFKIVVVPYRDIYYT